MSTYALQMLVNAVPGATGAVPYWNNSTRLWNTLAMGSALEVLRVNGAGTALEFAAPSGGSAQWESTGGVFQAKTAEVTTGDTFKFAAKETDGASAKAFIFDNANDLTTAGNRHSTWSSDSQEWMYLTGYGELCFTNVTGSAGGYRDKAGIKIFGTNSERYLMIKTSDHNDNAFDYPLLGWHGGSGSGYLMICDPENYNLTLALWSSNNAYPTHRYSYSYPFSYYSPVSLPSQGTNGYLGIDAYYSSGTYYNPDTGFWKSAATDGVLHQEYDGVDVGSWGDKFSTTNAATTTLWSTTLADNQVHIIEVMIVARRTDSAGRWSGVRRGTFYRAGGGATQEGTTEVVGTDVSNGITPTLIDFDVSSNDVRVRIQGEVGKNINWRCAIRKIHAT